MADPAQQLQNMNIQDLDFDPFAPQSKMAANHDGADDHQEGVTNGFQKHVSFEEQGYGVPGEGQDYGDGGGTGYYNTRGSSGDMSGFLPDHPGYQDSGQLEYTGDSDEDNDDGNLVDFGQGETQETYQGGDNAYYMQTGQPLVPVAPPGDNFSSHESSPFNQESMAESPNPLDDYHEDSEYSREGTNHDYYQNYDENTDPENVQPFEPGPFSPTRARRSLSPERSLSPIDNSSQAISAISPDADSEPSESLGSEAEGFHRGYQEFDNQRPSSIPTHHGGPDSPGQFPSSPKPMRSGLPRPKASPRLPRAKKPLELPPWNDNVVIPKPPRPKSTLIGKQQELPPRPKTAPTAYHRKDASSDSGVEEEKSTRKSSADSKKKYGIDAKNDRYKPAGGNVKIFSEKVDTKSVGSRIDTKPKVTTPRRSRESSESSVKSPTFNKPPSPSVKNVQSKIGSMDNVKHTPKGGDVKVLDVKTDYSKVTSKVGSKDKIDHKAAGGDKKIQSQKLSWTAESKVGSLKNATHKAGGGNVKVRNDHLSWQSSSKVGSLENALHVPGGGKVKPIETEELDWDADAKVNSLDNIDYEPGGGNVQIDSMRLSWVGTPRVGSLENIRYTPGGGNVKVANRLLKWSSKPRVDSLGNIHYVPGGGNVKILDQKVEVKAQSKVGSTANIHHKPGGGTKKIETQKLDFKETASPKVGSMDKVKHQPGGGDVKVVNERLSWEGKSKVNSLANMAHQPGGGKVQVTNTRLSWSARSRIRSLENADHVPGGGDITILDEKVTFAETAHAKVGSMDKVKHQPGGGDKKIETQKLSFKETASPRTNTGLREKGDKSRSESRSESVTSQDSVPEIPQ